MAIVKILNLLLSTLALAISSPVYAQGLQIPTSPTASAGTGITISNAGVIANSAPYSSAQAISDLGGTYLTSATAASTYATTSGLSSYLTTSTAATTYLSSTGTATNDNAAAGKIGQVVTATVASGSAVSLTTATPANITSVSLTAGDWQCYGAVDYTLTGATASDFKAGISATSATFGGQDSYTELPIITTLLSGTMTSPTPTQRISLASTTTEYLVGQETFSAGSVTAFGSLTCRRMR